MKKQIGGKNGPGTEDIWVLFKNSKTNTSKTVYGYTICVRVGSCAIHSHPERWALSVCVFISICSLCGCQLIVFLTHVLVLVT